jgi:hypothetical protein
MEEKRNIKNLDGLLAELRKLIGGISPPVSAR